MIISNITPELFKGAKSKVIQAGAQITHEGVNLDSSQYGTITGHGVVARFCYFEKSQTLTVSVDKKPFLITESGIENKVRDWFKA